MSPRTWSDSLDADGLLAVVGAGDMRADVRHASTGGYSRGPGDTGKQWCSETELAAIGDTHKHAVPDLEPRARGSPPEEDDLLAQQGILSEESRTTAEQGDEGSEQVGRKLTKHGAIGY